MIRGRIGEPIETVIAGHTVNLLVHRNGKRDGIAITVKVLDKTRPRSQDCTKKR